MTVKIIPITPEYRDGWERTFTNRKPTEFAPMITREDKEFLGVTDREWGGMSIEERMGKAMLLINKRNGDNA